MRRPIGLAASHALATLSAGIACTRGYGDGAWDTAARIDGGHEMEDGVSGAIKKPSGFAPRWDRSHIVV